MTETGTEESATPNGSDVPQVGPWLSEAVDGLVRAGAAVPAFELLEELGATERMPAADLRRLAVLLRRQGFLTRAERVAGILARAIEGSDDLGASLAAELSVLDGVVRLDVPAPESPYVPRAGQVLNVVGTSLPHVDSTFTRRTHAVAQSLSGLGLDVAVVTQMGAYEPDGYSVESFDGVGYHRIPGTQRKDLALDEWLLAFSQRLAAVVRKVRPAVVVASSDFVNGMAAHAVCRAYGIPMVYDVRGLWEDSWLARQRAEYDWSEDQVPGRWGLPEAWSRRRERELQLVAKADAVVASSDEVAAKLLDLGAESAGLTVIADPEGDSQRWLEVFESLGALEPGAAAVAVATRRGFDEAEVARVLGEAPRLPLDRIAGFGGFGTTRSIREEGWRHSSLEPLVITTPFDWVGSCLDNRSQGFHLHAWDFMVPFLKSWDRNRDRESLDWCLERAADWATTFTEGDARGTMAWYDMAIGLRAPRLAYLLQEAVHEGAAVEVVRALWLAVGRHQQEIFAGRAFNAGTNHGFYTAVGELSFARRLASVPAMDAVRRQGEERLAVVVATQFAEDGGHREHSPDYHRMLLSSFRDAMEDGLLTDPDLSARLSRAEEVMGWFIQPDRRIVQIGDSPARLISPEDKAAQSEHTQFLASGGRAGTPNDTDLLVLPEAGYGIVRSPQPRSRDDHSSAGYLTLAATFHSRAHKHCDDLSLTWFDGGQELLVDSGRYGYLDPLPPDSPQRRQGFFYARPERQYVESTRAHNTVQMDDTDHERRDRTPYGSGISAGEEREGVFRLRGEVRHTRWRHERSVTFKPGSWLLVEDVVSAAEDHDFTTWWNLSEALGDPAVDGSTLSFGLSGQERRLYVESLSQDVLVPVVKGQEEPLRGWRAAVDYEFTPIWSFGYRTAQVREHTFVTLLSLGSPLGGRPTSPFDA
ncbi:heparinase II/III family protein [Phycicoccus sp. DTK01]|uniref:heparinase II/III domain-containing protein n=1 Tax=Phycicoccus sp. DTK01 TaxID=2785745 RepID=UPI001A8CE5FC|nr:heparinase II/III family protein [Phycicoccus sp. DTK01]GIL34740.1 hypothetical protein PDTK01_08160 [Phycicoccus sp. DTK01]